MGLQRSRFSVLKPLLFYKKLFDKANKNLDNIAVFEKKDLGFIYCHSL
jgi:hypothetical protein